MAKLDFPSLRRLVSLVVFSVITALPSFLHFFFTRPVPVLGKREELYGKGVSFAAAAPAILTSSSLGSRIPAASTGTGTGRRAQGQPAPYASLVHPFIFTSHLSTML
jgi:hypothetical protein